ncbi:MAG: gyrA, partial [Gammaproteobacteria bacterium]|nr:gyrA [Gammaproteobacteria bacterium]
DESDRQGMRVVVEVRRGENAEVILNQLYTQTQLQLSFGINMVALDQGQPRLLNLKQLLESFISHRREVVTRRTIFELRKARERAHLLEGLAVALANIDKLVELIKSSASPQVAKERLLAEVWSPGLVTELLQNVDSNASRPSNLLAIYGLSEAGYRLSPEQAQAILDLRLHRLTGLETDKIHNEYKELMEFIKELLHILSSPERLLEVIKEELIDIKLRFGDARRTEIRDSEEDFSEEDLIADEPVVITLSKEGYIKAQPLEDYQAQRRGGKGRVATQMKQEDLVERLVVADTHDTLLCFSNTGRVYWLKAYRVPQASRMAKGRPLVNLLSLGDEERISAILALRNYGEDQFILMSTAQGTIKKMDLSHFARPRTQGIFVVSLLEGDQLVDVAVTDGDAQVMLFSDAGKVVRFHEDLVRPIGRSGRGVRGIRLKADQKLISMVVTKPDAYVLAATENGYGKRTLVSEYRESARGGQGMIAMRTSERNGRLVGALEVAEDDELMLISSTGKLVRTRVSEIPTLGRNTQGVKLIRLNENENLVGLQKVVEAEDGVSEEEL